MLHALVWLEQLLRNSPWWAVVAATVVLAWLVSRRIGLSLAMGALLCVIGVLGMWDAGMQTLALMIMAAGLSVLIGIPLGVLMARVNWLRSVMLPVLDVMQTMPSFVYLIPVVMLFGLGKIPAIIATVIYAVPPLIRLTDLGIRLVDRECWKPRAPSAPIAPAALRRAIAAGLPNIMAGINQTTMMALSMVVIASMIGARGWAMRCCSASTAWKSAVACWPVWASWCWPCCSTASPNPMDSACAREASDEQDRSQEHLQGIRAASR